jgi:UDP-N-acetylmuramate: L-alanyl-gamma-D-glutamyl-meso-diaminopimelate ligase
MTDLSSPCHIVIMSNGAFGGIHQRLIAKIERING